MGRTSIHFDLLDAFKQEGCPACRLALKSVSMYLDIMSYELVSDPGMREQIRAAHGFCNEHAYQWLQQRDALGTSIFYVEVLAELTSKLEGLRFHKHDLLSGVASLLNTGNGRTGEGRDGPDALEPDADCPVCRVLRKTESMAVETLVETLHEVGFKESYAASPGLCVPHLQRALRCAPDEESFKALIETALAGHGTLTRQLQEIIRKHDYRFSKEAPGDERGATVRTIRHVAGERGVRGLDLDGGSR
jgi:hypothetical protein